jgi:hypothetical protein
MQYSFRWLRSLLLWVGVLWIAWGIGWAAPGWTQDLAPDPRTLPEQILVKRPDLDSNNIPSEKVSQFVQACLQVITLIERREGDLQATATEAEATHIEQEIEAEALAIIERNGLTRQEYLQLLGLANTDPEFGERVAIQLQEMSI